MSTHQTHDHGPVPVERWGCDHVTTLLYLETRVVDHGGNVDAKHMRSDGDKYPTRLADPGEGNEDQPDHLPGHTDWHCLADFRAAGLLTGGERLPFREIQRPSRRLSRPAKTHAAVELTPLGWEVVGILRRFRAAGVPSARTVFSSACIPMERLEATGDNYAE